MRRSASTLFPSRRRSRGSSRPVRDPHRTGSVRTTRPDSADEPGRRSPRSARTSAVASPRGPARLCVFLQLRGCAWVAQLRECFRFDLPDALARERELFTDLFERARTTVRETEAKFEHATLAIGERVECAAKVFLQHRCERALGRLSGSFV